ncbi:peptidoglycan-binding protein [Streptomyces sp. ET3-23]|uniref:peptidoglycan-binding domain-containing protein n=1 Tax=Streptomyces sp. ET3-23 TaxID=2885643 RepID=UPI001D10C5B4|nr:peptidoglycan-binding domain-containing protein [Streptomyces sp. ET3-23]MCC2274130.1 peptidoglycan-binding protein [Streptomyces sp. ET3-23]
MPIRFSLASHRRGRRRWIPYAAGGATLLAALGVTALNSVGGGPGAAVSLPDAGGAADGLGRRSNATTPAGSSSVAAVPGHSDGATAESPRPSRASATKPSGRGTASTSAEPSRTPTTTAPTTTATLRRGDSGAAVSDLQHTLWRLGLYRGRQYGSYDADTAESVRKFQEWDGVHGDVAGEYGPNTRRALQAWASRL